MLCAGMCPSPAEWAFAAISKEKYYWVSSWRSLAALYMGMHCPWLQFVMCGMCGMCGMCVVYGFCGMYVVYGMYDTYGMCGIYGTCGM